MTPPACPEPVQPSPALKSSRAISAARDDTAGLPARYQAAQPAAAIKSPSAPESEGSQPPQVLGMCLHISSPSSWMLHQWRSTSRS